MSEKKHIEVLATFNLEESFQTKIKAITKSIHLTVIPAKTANDIPTDQWERTEVLFTNPSVLPETEWVPNLRWIQFNLAGIDKAISSKVIYSPHVIATSSSGVIVTQIAEYVVMWLLALGHKLPEIFDLQRKKIWPVRASKDFLPQELRGSTVGIVGYGSIGREVARLLKPFGCTILAAKKDAMTPQDTGYSKEGIGDPNGDFFTRLYPIEALPVMLTECDFVVLALPLTDQTREIFNEDAFNAMKPGAYLINIGRGALIDDDALVSAVQSGKLGGAALDVFTKEPLPEESLLWDLPGVYITPHISWVSSHIAQDLADFFIENLKLYLDGQPLYNQINVDKGY